MNHIVIVGGGTAGVVLAARLSEDPSCEVTLVEAGPAGDTPAELRDGASLPAIAPGHASNWGYRAFLQPESDIIVPRGRILGGSSAINGGYVIRARSRDFAGWAQVGGPEWSYESALPLLKKLENDLDFGDQPIHGNQGPLTLRRPPQSRGLAVLFTQAAKELGFPEEEDKNGDSRTIGVGAVPSNIIDGVRVNTAMAYLADARQRDNLRIMGDTCALRVLIEHGKAVGVETDHGVIDADEVVLAAGSVATPHLLMLSGIGPTDQLTAHGIATVSDLPVGQSFSDHPNLSVSWHSSLPLVNPAERFAFPAALNFDSSGSDGHYPDGDLEILLSVKPLSLLLRPDVASQPADGTDEYHVMVSLQSPRGRGHMTLASDDPLVQPRIDYNYLADEVDAERMRVGVRTAARLLQSAAFEGTFASFSSLSGEILADDELLDEWITTHLSTAIHLSGSAPMGEVVDGHGRVYGVDALRVADTSILPAVPSRGTFNAAVFIGEFIAHQMVHARSR
jgi:predicted dehydrogenase (TIGR03970 family)